MRLFGRMFRAAMFDKGLYEEASSGLAGTGQAFLIVVIVAIATGIGTYEDEGRLAGLPGLPPRIVLGFIAWIVWASVAYAIGTKLLATAETNASWGSVARTFGFAHSPGVLRALGILPNLSFLMPLLTAVWIFVAMSVAAKEALGYHRAWRAIVVTLVGFVAQVFIYGGLFGLLIVLEGS